MLNELKIPKPEFKRRISSLEVIQGTVVSAIDKVNSMDEDSYEAFTLEWIDGYLQPKYSKIRSYAGAGDKGRDVVGYYPDGSIDIYQCKHYNNKIAPTTLYPELGKLCYYTFIKEYPIPKKYYIVAPRGCGPEVLDLINAPQEIAPLLIDNWEKYCQNKITSTKQIKLEGEFSTYVENFNFSIVVDIAPHELITQHEKTLYHIMRFGGGIKKFRKNIPVPAVEIQVREQKYTTMLFGVYEQKLNVSVRSIEDLKKNSVDLLKHFNTQRNSFYSAESLDKFSRENFPEADPMPFDELKDDAETVLSTTLDLSLDKTGYERVLLASQEIKRQNFASNALANEIKPIDKDGLCHHLANEEKIKWIL